jgi:predicted ATPase
MRPDLPTGTVTFLFTDVEGSTRLLEEIGDEAYEQALSVHRRIVRAACQAHDGVEVDTQGDAFFFAFSSATAAASAASATRETLAPGPIHVRIGLHTGTPRVTDEGYVGKDVHFAARVAATGHGGQIVVSKATAELVDDGSLTDLGEHRLKDIEHAVAIFQLGTESFPPLKTISNTNLPRPASSFVGREQELDALLALIEQGARLVTLTGPGGSGKTRLALEAASTLVPEYKAGLFWVGLASLRDPALVTEQISQTLGAKDGLTEHIAEREMLLLIDNLEQVVEAAPELSSLLQGCPNLTLLVTSRELLRVQGEVEYEVPPLQEPEAVSLFRERSKLEPSDEIAELCRRLDSLPLAVELAAARTKALSPKQILDRLSSRLDLLKAGRDADPRQQTLRATIEWSHELLAEDEQRLFCRLSVFAGGCTLAAAEEVCDADLDTLQSLVEKSLLRFSNERYWMLETIREYAAERLAEADRTSISRRRHAEHVRKEVRRLSSDLRRLDPEALERIGPEQDNIRSAFSWAANQDVELVADLLKDLTGYWIQRGRANEALHMADMISGLESATPEVRSTVLSWMSELFRFTGRTQESIDMMEELLPAFLELGDERAVIATLKDLGQEYAALGDFVKARERVREAMERARSTGDQTRMSEVQLAKGVIEFKAGDFEAAEECFVSSLKTREAADDRHFIGYVHLMIGECAWRTGRHDDAVVEFQVALKTFIETGERLSLPEIFDELAALAVRRDQAISGARLLGSADQLRREMSVPVWDPVEVDRTTRKLRNSLGQRAFEAELEWGRVAPESEMTAVAASVD